MRSRRQLEHHYVRDLQTSSHRKNASAPIISEVVSECLVIVRPPVPRLALFLLFLLALAALLGAPLAIQAGDEDILDALAALWSAQRIHSGAAVRLPAEEERDELGLPMQMLA